MYCPSCGREIPDGSSFCLHCGERMPAEVLGYPQGPDITEAPLVTAEPGCHCPKCKLTDNVRKVSSLFSEGVSLMQMQGWKPPPGQTNLPPVSTVQYGVSQSGLSQRLAPPPQPAAPRVSCWVWGFGALLTAIGAWGLSFYSAAYPLLALVPGLVILGLATSYYVGGNRRREEEMPRWERAVGRWNELYYCGRCDGVFVPGETALITTDRLSTLLYNQ